MPVKLARMIIACPRCQLRYDATGRSPGSSMSCRCGNALTIPATPNTARRLQCPNCGGPVPVDSARCPFCETDLAVLTCPGCFGLQFLGTRFCSDCGTELNKPARSDEQRELDCPRCSSALTTRSYQFGAVDHCKACGGLWLDHRIFENTVNHTREKSEVSLQTTKPAQHNVFNNHPVNYLPCPECSTLMHRRNFAQRSGIIVDVCTSHGVWLDHKELSAILNFIREGGMKKPAAPGVNPLSPPTVQRNTHRSASNTPPPRPVTSLDDGIGWGDVIDFVKSLPIFK